MMELKDIEFGHNYIIGGDFNTTMGNNEERGGSTVRDAQQEYMEDLIPKPLRCQTSKNLVYLD